MSDRSCIRNPGAVARLLALLILLSWAGGLPLAHGHARSSCLDGVEAAMSDHAVSSIDELARKGLGTGPEALAARSELQSALGLDDLNFSYFWRLYEKSPRTPGEGGNTALLRIGDTVFPTAIAPEELLTRIPLVEYQALLRKAKGYRAVARRTTLWVKKMHAGTGSSVTRATFLARLRGTRPEKIQLGAKGTDLFVQVPDPRHPGKKVEVSLVEAQLLQALQDANRGEFGGIALHDIVSSETQESVRAVWRKKSLIDPSKTYEELLRDSPRLTRAGEILQAYIPTLNEKGELTRNRMAPGGHALFGVDAIRSAYLPGAPRRADGSPLVAVVGNGEDLSSTPDPVMVGYMVKNEIPVAMVTTDKTANDLKGGQIAIAGVGKGQDPYVTILEKAQAEDAGQLELFEKLGLDIRSGDQKAYFNTNMALINYDVLERKIARAIHDFGEERVLREVSPDLISNPKKQKDLDGVEREYKQLEGAMGSSLLNLDRFFRQHYHEPLVHFINVDRLNRTRFFSPIKSAFDYFMQFHSDRFTFNPTTMRLTNERPGLLPAVELKDKYYQDVQNVLDAFQGTSIRDLSSLKINGQVRLPHVVLRGNVTITNPEGNLVDLSEYLARHPELKIPRDKQGRPVLENVRLDLGPQGSAMLSSFP